MSELLNPVLDQIHEKAFGFQVKDKEYVVERGLFAEYRSGVKINPKGGYNYIVRGPGNHSLAHTLEERAVSGGGIDLLDVGCGAGRFLLDCADRWPGLVRGCGITAYFYNRIYQFNPLESTPQAHRRLGIDIRLGDAQKLTHSFPHQQFDIITAVFVASYLADPWALIQGTHAKLKLGGIGYVNNFLPKNMSNEEIDELYRFMKGDSRFEVEGSNLVYQKTGLDLEIPLSYEVTPPSQANPLGALRYRLLV